MRIVVCIKQVPNTTEITIDTKTGSLLRDGVASIINPDDKAALEEALILKDRFNVEVILLSMGPLQVETMLRESMAMGADKSILLSDKAFSGSDTWSTAYILSTAIKKLQADIVFTGRQAIDGDTAQVGPQIAEMLDLPQVSYVKEIYTEDCKEFIVTKKLENGYQKVKVKKPCLFTVLSGINKPRYMGGGYSNPLEIWTLEELELNPNDIGIKGSPTQVLSSYIKPARGVCQMYDLTPIESADLIMTIMQEKHII